MYLVQKTPSIHDWRSPFALKRQLSIVYRTSLHSDISRILQIALLALLALMFAAVVAVEGPQDIANTSIIVVKDTIAVAKTSDS